MSENIITCKIMKSDNEALILPVPSDIQFGKERICKEQRALDGTMIIDMIAVKNSLEIAWNLMGDTDLKALKKAVDSTERTFFDIEIMIKPANLVANKQENPQPQESEVFFGGTVYLSDFTYVPYFINGGFAWKDVVMKVVEK